LIEPIFVETVDGVPAIIKDLVKAGDIVITQGAGNVGVLSPALAKRRLQ
jgi:UDP-N-acetylmuramate--alanine ligase